MEHPASWIVLLVFTSLATYRLTRLIVRDDFPLVAIPRAWVVGADGTKHIGRWWHWFGELVSCHWCASGWVSLALSAIVYWTRPYDAPLIDWALLWFASWALGAVAADRVERSS